MLGYCFGSRVGARFYNFFSHIYVLMVMYYHWVHVREFDLGYAWTDMDRAHSD